MDEEGFLEAVTTFKTTFRDSYCDDDYDDNDDVTSAHNVYIIFLRTSLITSVIVYCLANLQYWTTKKSRLYRESS